MKPVANSIIPDEIPIGSIWQPLRGCRFSISMGAITVTQIDSQTIHYIYGGGDPFSIDKSIFLQYARRLT